MANNQSKIMAAASSSDSTDAAKGTLSSRRSATADDSKNFLVGIPDAFFDRMVHRLEEEGMVGPLPSKVVGECKVALRNWIAKLIISDYRNWSPSFVIRRCVEAFAASEFGRLGSSSTPEAKTTCHNAIRLCTNQSPLIMAIKTPEFTELLNQAYQQECDRQIKPGALGRWMVHTSIHLNDYNCFSITVTMKPEET